MNETTLNTVWNPADHRDQPERMRTVTLALSGAVALAWLVAMVYVISAWTMSL